MDITNRLTQCFQTVFPDLDAVSIPAASQANVPVWDSVAAVTLVNVIEDEFGIEMDLDQIADLDSFGKMEEHLRRQLQAV